MKKPTQPIIKRSPFETEPNLKQVWKSQLIKNSKL